jgi:hypothetical protein
VKRLYATGEGGTVMWVTVETSLGIGNKREVFVPLGRLKQEHDELRVPYTSRHIHEAPEIEPRDELSDGEDRALRDYYSIDLADQELRTDNDSYAGQVPGEQGGARRIEADEARAPERDTGEAAERIRHSDDDQLGDRPRKATAGDVFDED